MDETIIYSIQKCELQIKNLNKKLNKVIEILDYIAEYMWDKPTRERVFKDLKTLNYKNSLKEDIFKYVQQQNSRY